MVQNGRTNIKHLQLKGDYMGRNIWFAFRFLKLGPCCFLLVVSLALPIPIQSIARIHIALPDWITFHWERSSTLLILPVSPHSLLNFTSINFLNDIELMQYCTVLHWASITIIRKWKHCLEEGRQQAHNSGVLTGCNINAL